MSTSTYSMFPVPASRATAHSYLSRPCSFSPGAYFPRFSWLRLVSHPSDISWPRPGRSKLPGGEKLASEQPTMRAERSGERRLIGATSGPGRALRGVGASGEP